MRKIKLIRQMNMMQCGASCLTMILQHLGVNVDIHRVDRIMGSSKDGVSLLAIIETARHFGLDPNAIRIKIDKLKEIPLPAILYWKSNHYVVLYKIDKRNNYYIADPDLGYVKYSLSEFKENWISHQQKDKGISIIFNKNETVAFNEINVGTASSMSFIYSHLKPYRKILIHIMVALFFGAALQLVFPFLTQLIVDVGIGQKNLNFIWLILIGELFVISGGLVYNFLRRWFILYVSGSLNIVLVSEFIVKILNLPISFSETHQVGDFLQRLSDHNRIQVFLTNQSIGILFSAFSFVTLSIVLCLYGKLISFVFFASCVVLIGWNYIFLAKRRKLDYEMFNKQAIDNDLSYQLFSAIVEIKLQGCERRRLWEWEDAQSDLYEVRHRSLRIEQIQEAGVSFINELKNILITVFSASCVIDGNMSLGGMLAIQYIIGQLSSPIEQLMSFAFTFQEIKISLERINEIHNNDNEDTDEKLADEKVNGEIELRNVCFSYDKHSSKNVLENICIRITAGKVTAIVGPSGSGKTTLVKLLLGFYKVNKGEIIISGRNINCCNLKWWRRKCGVVMQDGVIFNETIARNIAVGDGDIDENKLMEAANLACIADFIDLLPSKYRTVIGRNGIELSKGQKQRLLIARAIYKDPEFIILDEATNSLDTVNESKIVENLTRFYADKTVVIVAHRMSTIKNADNIVVLNNGRIEESGTHEELIRKKGVYRELVKMQLEYIHD